MAAGECLGKIQFVSFRINDHLMGIDILKVREVNLLLDITPVPHSRDYIRGLINLRGQTVTVFDLGVKLGMASHQITDTTHNIILKGDDVGLLVDSIGDVIEASKIEPPPANIDLSGLNYVAGVVPLEQELMIVLVPERLLNDTLANSEGEETGS